MTDDLHCFYRLAQRPAAEPKRKLPGATKAACLRNFVAEFGADRTTVFGDRLDDAARRTVLDLGARLIDVDHGSGGGTFRAAAAAAMALPPRTPVYLVEDDFLHRPGAAAAALADGLALGEAYVTLYDHPDKYLAPAAGGNPRVRRGGEATRLLCGHACHWKVTNSTVMTFATTAGQLAADWRTILRHCGGRYTDDYRLFRSLAWRGRRLLSAVPGFATHCEAAWLSPAYRRASVAQS